MKYLITSGFFLHFLSLVGYSQKEANIWYFGKNSALNFNSGTAQVLYNSAMNATDGCASISDRNGTLLFYTDGWWVWNRNHQMMTNGFGLGQNSEATQSGVIVPQPGNDSIYYVFSQGQLGGTLHYSIVNMNRQNGLGEVVLKKVFLISEMCEKITAVKHCNKNDIWVITRKFNSDQYCSFLVTNTGLTTTPVVSSTGNFIMNTNGMEFEKAMGMVKNSPDGKKIAAAHYLSDYVELCDFNSTSGIVSNPKKLYANPQGLNPPVLEGCYGVEFSADSRMLYVSSSYALYPNNDTTTIYQFNITSNSEATIQASKTHIAGDNNFSFFYSMQLGPDKRIYVARSHDYLSVINNPEVVGSGCNFVMNGVYLDDGTMQHLSNTGLPNFIQSYFYDPIIATGNCQFQNISFTLQNILGVSSVLWNFGDPASGNNNSSTSFTPTHIFSQQGAYEVKVILYNANGCGADTIRKLVHAGPFQVYLGNDTSFCEGDTLTLRLSMDIPGANFVWSNNTVDTFIKIAQPGTYWVRVNIGECVASDTINVALRPLPSFTLGNDTLICPNQAITLSPSPNAPNVGYLWNTGGTSSSVNVNQPGSYWLQITENGYGCTFRDTINIQLRSLPNYTLGNDTSLCDKNSLTLDASLNGATGYLWSTGATTSTINVAQSDIYWADVTKDQCVYRDSINVIFKVLPTVKLGNDTTICEGQTLLLDAGNIGSVYQWQNNNTSRTLVVSAQGSYWAKVTSNGCSASDTISVSYDLKPVFTIGKDTSICDGMIMQLQPEIQNPQGVSYVWGNGATTLTIPVSQTGLYTLTASNYCGSKYDEIMISKGICKIYVPSAFTPNNDGLNDIFKASFGEDVTEFKLEVYNRWGQIVFKTNDIRKGWDGNIKGYKQSNGVYVWILKYKTVTDSKEQMMKGTVTLIR